MNSVDDNSPSMREWCNGLPLQRVRELGPQERSELETEVQRARSGVWRWGCGFPLLMWGALMILVTGLQSASEKLRSGFMGQNFDAINSVLAGIAVFLFCVPSVGWLRARDWRRWRRDALADLDANSVSVYRDAVEKAVQKQEGDPDLLEKVAPSLREHSLEVLSASRRILTCDGERVSGHQMAPATKIAETPPAAARAAAWTTPLTPTALREEGEGLNRRDLSLGEREEIERYAGKMWKPLLWPAIGFSSWIGIPLTLHLVTQTPTKPEPMAYFVGAMAVWFNWNLARTVWLSRRLQRDAAGGTALVVRFLPDPAEPELPQSGEFLPLSGVEWTVDGQPSAWRHHSI